MAKEKKAVEVVLRFPLGFLDFGVLPEKLNYGDVRVVDEVTARRCMESDPNVEVLERRLKVNPEAQEALRKMKEELEDASS